MFGGILGLQVHLSFDLGLILYSTDIVNLIQNFNSIISMITIYQAFIILFDLNTYWSPMERDSYLQSKKLEQKEQKQLQSSMIIPINPQTFSFHLQSPIQQYNLSLLQIKDSMTVRVKPTSMNFHLPSKEHSLKSSRQRNIWKPKIPQKRLFDEPRFLLSLQRKKIRVINGLKDSQFECNKKELKVREGLPKGYRISESSNHPKNSKAHSYSEIKSQELRKEQSVEDEENFFNQIKFTKKPKTPNLNFNLHHLIKQRKHFIQNKKDRSLNAKTGSNSPYFQFFASSKFATAQNIKPNTVAHSRKLHAFPNRGPTAKVASEDKSRIMKVKQGHKNN